jgi:hypothetical protein
VSPSHWGWRLESTSILESIAEVAIALAGFGGIAAGLGYRARGTWSPDDQFRLMMLAGAALAVVFACFVPYVAHQLGSPAPWRMASAILLLLPASALLYGAWFLRRGLPAGYSRIASWVVVIAHILALALLFPAALGYAGARESGFYVTAILLMLFQASLLFLRLLATSFRSSEPASGAEGDSHVT